MNKNLVIMVISIIVVLAVAYFLTWGIRTYNSIEKYRNLQPQVEGVVPQEGDEKMEATPKEAIQYLEEGDSWAKGAESVLTEIKDAEYIPYQSGIVGDLSNTGYRVVLFFYANWCPTCKAADADILNNRENIPSDVSIVRVNYNDTDTDQEEKDLAKKYNITYQHTFVEIDSDGNEIQKWNGGNFSTLLKKLEE